MVMKGMVGLEVLENDKNILPWWEKYTLSVSEASKYFKIGEKKLRKIIYENESADFILWNGSRPQIKKKLFERYIDDQLTAI